MGRREMDGGKYRDEITSKHTLTSTVDLKLCVFFASSSSSFIFFNSNFLNSVEFSQSVCVRKWALTSCTVNHLKFKFKHTHTHSQCRKYGFISLDWWQANELRWVRLSISGAWVESTLISAASALDENEMGMNRMCLVCEWMENATPTENSLACKFRNRSQQYLFFISVARYLLWWAIIYLWISHALHDDDFVDETKANIEEELSLQESLQRCDASNGSSSSSSGTKFDRISQ